jgi:hypothetical protein
MGVSAADNGMRSTISSHGNPTHMLHLIFVKRSRVCHGGSRNIDSRIHRVIGDGLNQVSVEFYVTSQLHKGYYLLARDGAGRWYWGTAHDGHPDFTTTLFHGPCSSRGKPSWREKTGSNAARLAQDEKINVRCHWSGTRATRLTSGTSTRSWCRSASWGSSTWLSSNIWSCAMVTSSLGDSHVALCQLWLHRQS